MPGQNRCELCGKSYRSGWDGTLLSMICPDCIEKLKEIVKTDPEPDRKYSDL